MLYTNRFVSPIDILLHTQRVLAVQPLPNGDVAKVVQYWNEGDFYNLELRIYETNGAYRYCVIDPDCFRFPSCRIDFSSVSGHMIISAGHENIGSYNWALREFTKANGVTLPRD